MWGKFFAFAMLILIILVVIQFSTLSDEDVEKIKTKIEERQQNKSESGSLSNTEVTDQSTTEQQQDRVIENPDDVILSEPAILAYEDFLDAVPKMKFDSEMNQYLVIEEVNRQKELFAGFSSDPLEAFQLFHDFKAMEYMEFRYIDDKKAVFHFIASSGLMRRMGQVVGDANEDEILELFEVVMVNNADQWMVQRETANMINNPAFGIEQKSKYKLLLEKYYAKRRARLQN